MKRLLTGCLLGLLLTAAPPLLDGQNPPAPNWGNDPSGGNSPVGGGASLGGGIVTMLVLAAGYGTRRVYQHRKRILE